MTEALRSLGTTGMILGLGACFGYFFRARRTGTVDLGRGAVRAVGIAGSDFSRAVVAAVRACEAVRISPLSMQVSYEVDRLRITVWVVNEAEAALVIPDGATRDMAAWHRRSTVTNGSHLVVQWLPPAEDSYTPNDRVAIGRPNARTA